MPALVWFKRDLRLTDHAAVHAARQGAPDQPLRGLYIAEPGLWALPDAAAQHWAFVRESLL
ncbi:MAG: deoxyribodipyrimidine photo-lyase, partial [Aquabacterium commune]|uniref:deoxyribodipyrimidine photo-lyase n=3 Tax=Aquabacterium TaxID=92793 RepID=UPI003BB21570